MTQRLVSPPPPSGVRGEDLASALRNPRPRRGGDTHSQAVSLKDSDGSELIGAFFILDDRRDFFFFFTSLIFFHFSEASVSVCVSLLFRASLSLVISPWRCWWWLLLWSLKPCCRPERLSPQFFNEAESKRATLRSCGPNPRLETQRGVKCPL